jgi:Berberine and berberine like.
VRYWENYSQLQTIKRTWDPRNVFNHCHSVGSSDNTCCPDYQVSTRIVSLSLIIFNDSLSLIIFNDSLSLIIFNDSLSLIIFIAGDRMRRLCGSMFI